MDGGIGESLLLENVLQGAIVGGGLSALTGGDFLTGALTGGIGGGVKGFLPDFTKIFSPAGTAGTDVATSAVSQAAPSAVSQAGQAFMGYPSSLLSPGAGIAGNVPAGTYGFTADGLNRVAESAITTPAAAQNPLAVSAQNQNVPATDVSKTLTGNPPTPPTDVNRVGTQATQPVTDYAKIIQNNNVKPIGLAVPGTPDGITKTGDYIYNGKIYSGKVLANAPTEPSFFQKYKWPLIGGGLGIAALMANQQPKFPTVQQPNYPKFGLASNYAPVPNPTPVYPRFAEGGIAALAAGGNMGQNKVNVDFMHGDMYPMSQQQRSFYATPTQMPISAQQAMASYEPKTNPMTGQATANMASGGTATSGQVYYDAGKGQYYTLSQNNPVFQAMPYSLTGNIRDIPENRNYIGTSLNSNGSGVSPDFTGSSVTPQVYTPSYTDIMVPNTTTPATPLQTPTYSLADSAALLQATSPGIASTLGLQEPEKKASGGIADLGSYSDGGRMLHGPGDGMSDSIPGVIGGKRPARLAEGEFVVPADVVSHLGNGSTDAGAKQLYAMMNKVRQARTGTKKQGKQINPRSLMPA